AAQAAVTSVVLSHGAPGRTRVDRRFPALSSLRGHSPAQEIRWAAVGKRVMSTPISATRTWATVSLTPGIVTRKWVCCRIGAKAFPTAASSAAGATLERIDELQV